MKNKKILIIPVILLLIILVAGGSFAYIYFKTDILKSDKQLFFEYVLGDTSDERLKQYYKKQLDTPYEFEASAYIEAGDDAGHIEGMEQLEKFDIKFKGVNDVKAQEFDINASLNYNDEEILPISIAKTDSIIGITTEVLDKYIAIDYERESKNSLGLEEIAKTAVENIYDQKEILTKEDIQYLKDTYMNILMEKLTDEKFSEVIGEDEKGYRLELTSKEIIETVVNVLEKLKDDERILNIINKEIEKIEEQQLDISKDDLKITKEKIEETIEGIKEEILTDEPEEELEEILNSKLVVVIWAGKDKKISKVEIEQDKLGKLEVKIKQTQDSIEYIATIDMASNRIENQYDEATINFGVKYTGLEKMEEVSETYNCLVNIIDDEDNEVEMNGYVNNEIKFATNPYIVELEESNTWMLTPNTDASVQKFLINTYNVIMKELQKNIQILID